MGEVLKRRPQPRKENEGRSMNLIPIHHKASDRFLLCKDVDGMPIPLTLLELEALLEERRQWQMREIALRAEVETLAPFRTQIETIRGLMGHVQNGTDQA